MEKTILVIEDNEDLLYFVTERLKRNGYVVQVACNSTEALASSDKKPHLILSDIIIPGLQPKDYIDELEKKAEATHTPIIYMTALRSRDEQQRAGVSMDDKTVFTKPFDWEKLLTTISTKLQEAA